MHFSCERECQTARRGEITDAFPAPAARSGEVRIQCEAIVHGDSEVGGLAFVRYCLVIQRQWWKVGKEVAAEDHRTVLDRGDFDAPLLDPGWKLAGCRSMAQ